ncbi:glycosyltransferase [Mesobacillus zeae]|uniref:glycosyltransferase n=1 Tax=Mesobacillus zeae TaxID=1917180 RepID=UPI0015E74ABC|nr:glycosyltransferase [Mesobacillus zeae]
MAGKYKLSVVVLVYNTEPYLRDCFDSLVNQTLTDIEIIIVNDESPDNSAVIIEEYRKKYDNITVINQKNAGGAVAGNKGLHAASGEYVTIMDSDDIVPLDGYEKLYNKAKEMDADIAIGRPHLYIEGNIREVNYKKESDVWKKERVITDLLQFPDIFYDCFYWNKIYKRELLFNNNCFMPPGMLYADRPMVHKAYLYSKKIVVIPEVVYLWRKRGNTEVKSITQLTTDIGNFKDRISSLYYQIDYFNAFGNEQIKTEFLKRNLDRLFFPIKNIVFDGDFREAYLEEVGSLLKTIPDVYNNDLGIVKNLYIYMIIHGMEEELIHFLESEPSGSIKNENGLYYWALPLFRNQEVDIPDKFFMIDVMQSQFVKISRLEASDKRITIDEVSVPEYFHVEKAEIEFISRINAEEKMVFDLQSKSEHVFTGHLELPREPITNVYEVYLSFKYNGREDRFRITKKMFDSFDRKNELSHGRLYFQKGSLLTYLVISTKIKEICMDESGVRIEAQDPLTQYLDFYLKDRKTGDKIYFHRKENGVYVLPWKHFLETNSTYDFYLSVMKSSKRLTEAIVSSLSGEPFTLDKVYREVYKTNKNNISLKAVSSLRKKIRC